MCAPSRTSRHHAHRPPATVAMPGLIKQRVRTHQPAKQYPTPTTAPTACPSPAPLTLGHHTHPVAHAQRGERRRDGASRASPGLGLGRVERRLGRRERRRGLVGLARRRGPGACCMHESGLGSALWAPCVMVSGGVVVVWTRSRRTRRPGAPRPISHRWRVALHPLHTPSSSRTEQGGLCGVHVDGGGTHPSAIKGGVGPSESASPCPAANETASRPTGSPRCGRPVSADASGWRRSARTRTRRRTGARTSTLIPSSARAASAASATVVTTRRGRRRERRTARSGCMQVVQVACPHWIGVRTQQAARACWSELGTSTPQLWAPGCALGP